MIGMRDFTETRTVGSGLKRGGKPVLDWPTIRAWVIERDGGLCRICFGADATDADHIWPRRLGGPNHIDNLRAACGPCNKKKSASVVIAAASPAEVNQGVEALTKSLRRTLAEIESLIEVGLSRAEDEDASARNVEELRWLLSDLRGAAAEVATSANRSIHSLEAATAQVQRV